MTDRPIIFSVPMIRALLDGRKTQTRRVLKPQPPEGWSLVGLYAPGLTAVFDSDDPPGPPDWALRLPYMPGDRLWVREAWARWLAPEIFGGPPQWITEYRAGKLMLAARYEGDYDIDNWKQVISEARKPDSVPWKSPIYMPRRLSRLTLIVTDVRVQRVQEISEEDARAEGVERWKSVVGQAWANYANNDDPFTFEDGGARASFHTLWDSLNARRGFGWSENPWVVALTVTVHRQNIDQMQEAA